jgi:two-component system, LytTR family, response regulator
MIKAIIIDDEKHCIITLKHVLSQFEDIEIVATSQDSTTAKALIDELKPDILFIDIEMPQLNGFDVLQQFDSLPFKIVFTTAYDQYAIKALKINALDYLLKPIDKNDIVELIEKYKNQEIVNSKEQVKNLHIFRNGALQDTIALSTTKGCYTHIIMNDKTKQIASKTLAAFDEVLTDNPLFFRAHKSHIINLKCIKQYVRGEGGDIIMENGYTIALSRNKKQEFLNLFTKV